MHFFGMFWGVPASGGSGSDADHEAAPHPGRGRT